MENRPKILIIDDNKTNLDILMELLSDNYDIIPSLDPNIALNILKAKDIDLILLDIVMPKMSGYELCKIIKSDEDIKDIPILFITAKEDEDSIEKAYNLGGADYITKPFKNKEVKVRVKTQLVLKKTIEHLQFISSYDQLTGIYNRRKFFETALLRFEEDKENLYGVMIDIDKFKNINDSYGHPVGDIVLKKVTNLIKTSLDKSFIFGRLGGEEFAIICNMKNRQQIYKKIEEIRKDIEKKKIVINNNLTINATISCGISKYKDQKTLDDLLKDADIALYEAKGSGRNRSIFRGE